MAKKSKKAKKSVKRKPTPKKKDNKMLGYLFAGLLIVAVYYFLFGVTDQPSGEIQNCVFSTSSNKVDCDVIGTLECNTAEDIVVLVKDDAENSMVAFNSDGSSLMGYVDVGDKLESVVVSVPGESLIDETSGCSEVFLICGENVYSSECAFA